MSARRARSATHSTPSVPRRTKTNTKRSKKVVAKKVAAKKVAAKTHLGRYIARLEERGGKAAYNDFLKRADSSDACIKRIANQGVAPGALVIRRIKIASRGKVTTDQLVEDAPGHDKPTRVGISTIKEAREREARAKKKAARRKATSAPRTKRTSAAA